VLFNTTTYAYFFAAVFVVSWLLAPWRKLRLTFLLLSSYVFYAGWTFVGWDRLLAAEGSEFFRELFQSIKYVPLLFVATSIDFYLGVALGRMGEAHKEKGDQGPYRKPLLAFARLELPSRRKLMLVATVALNVGILVFFKYWNWGADTFSWLVHQLTGREIGDIHLRVELPIGISFFCFMSLSYVIDVYRGAIPYCRSYLNYLTYISFFPHLVAGPIIRGRDLLPHLERDTHLTAKTGGEGLFLIASGLFKKVVIGDFIAINFVDRVFAEPSSYSSLEVMAAMYGYAVQVYCDFAGYSEVAIGSALLLGYRFKINFDAPFKATNIVEFWRRWHVSLSTWLRDYVYIPLGGSRHGEVRKYFAMFVTMVICGVWHGAAWTYFVFGCIQGAALSVTHWFQSGKGKSRWVRLAIALGLSIAADAMAAYVAYRIERPGITLLVSALISGAWMIAALVALGRFIEARCASGTPARALEIARRVFAAALAAAFAGVVVFMLRALAQHALAGGTASPADMALVRLLAGLGGGQVVLVALAIGAPLGWRYLRVGFVTVLCIAANFTFVGLTFTMFRAASLDRAWSMYERLLTFTSYTPNLHVSVMAIILGALVLQWTPRVIYDWVREVFIRAPAPVQAVVLFVVAIMLREAASSEAVPFVYFQF
jgi:D-alanyl-lipoteichoic acid acyltransferase DltB (MBOAT superfamily)